MSSSGTGIPTGLNRIKTTRESISSSVNRRHDSELNDLSNKTSVVKTDDDRKGVLPAKAASLPPPPPASSSSKTNFVSNSQSDYRKLTGFNPGYYRRKKKLTGWLSSYLSRESSQDVLSIPQSVEGVGNIGKATEKEACRKLKVRKDGTNIGELHTWLESSSSKKATKDFKSFSHELGLGGEVPAAYTRVHSYDDLKELLSSFHVRFDRAKETVNLELASFTQDVMDYLQQNKAPLTGQQMAEGLLILAQNCIEMTCLEFRAKCEGIVHGLTEKRQLCQNGLLKWLFTRMLFILTRCTRLLQVQKDADADPVGEKEFHKIQCMSRRTTVESDWLCSSGADVASSDDVSSSRGRIEMSRNERNIILTDAINASFQGYGKPINDGLKTDKESMLLREELFFPNCQTEQVSQDAQTCQFEVSRFSKSPNETSCDYELQQSPDRFLGVICRICEEMVPAVHLEPHSYLCAHADKCDSKFSNIDERLCRLAEVLEHIVDSRNNISPSLENPRLRSMQTEISLEGCSPRMNDWESKSVEGMFEDIHEMDTAEIDDSHLANIMFLKGPLSIKFSTYGPSSSRGSMTSGSSTNTPRSAHFDLSWLEHYSDAAEEDVNQIRNIADIARCAAAADVSEEGSCEFLMACMHDLQELLEQSKHKALVVDTFGGRMEALLQEKSMLSHELMDSKNRGSDGEANKSLRNSLDDPSQSSAVSTPVHPSNKERIGIDDFEILKPISSGAFGKVFLARKRTTGDLFAIKVLKKLDMICKNDTERIFAERNILIAVRNPFVVRFYFSFTSRDNLYLVMEYLNGGDLYSLLRKIGCLEEEVARVYIAELVLALEYIHSLGIVHRDLKPDNILISHNGHIKLTDFGLSRYGLINSTASLNDVGKASFDAPDHTTQRTEAAVGTPDYLAPEILLGTEHGYAADWWSVGIILFELITGIPPFSASRPEIIFDNILTRKIPWPPIPGNMSLEAQDLIERLLTVHPDKRLGETGSSEVKQHPFFKGVNWETLALQKAAFVPQPDAVDDTSYFITRQGFRMSADQFYSDSDDPDSDSGLSSSDVELEMDACAEIAEFHSTPIDLSLINFSFKNLSQLATINRDVLLKTERDTTKCSSSA